VTRYCKSDCSVPIYINHTIFTMTTGSLNYLEFLDKNSRWVVGFSDELGCPSLPSTECRTPER